MSKSVHQKKKKYNIPKEVQKIDIFNSNLKKTSVNKLDNTNKDYQTIYNKTLSASNTLYDSKTKAESTIQSVIDLINSIANTPKDFDHNVKNIKIKHTSYKKEINHLKNTSKKTDYVSGAVAGAGVLASAGIANFGPGAAMALAVNFGTASTGTAIASLSGAAAENAALAWLGGGALAAEGGGMAAGSSLLGMFGPIGWVVGGATVTGAAVYANRKNKSIATKAQSETKKIQKEIQSLKSLQSKMIEQNDEILSLNKQIEEYLKLLKHLANGNYILFTERDKYQLTSLVNFTNALSSLIIKKVS